MTYQEACEILGVPVSATRAQIKRAYQKLAMKHHPDKGGNEDDFKNINAAYEFLYKHRGQDRDYSSNSDNPHQSRHSHQSHSSRGQENSDKKSHSSTANEHKNPNDEQQFQAFLDTIRGGFDFLVSIFVRFIRKFFWLIVFIVVVTMPRNDIEWPVSQVSTIQKDQTTTSSTANTSQPSETPIVTKFASKATLSVRLRGDGDAIYPANSELFIDGSVPEHCSKIEVSAYNNEDVVDPSYVLQKFQKGDTQFVYTLRKDLGNFLPGEMIYSFKAYCEDEVLTDSMRVWVDKPVTAKKETPEQMSSENVENTVPASTSRQSDQVNLPEHGVLTYLGNDWTCDRGYRRNDRTNSCDKVILPEHGVLTYLGDDWACDRGYKKNEFRNTCDEVILPKHGVLTYLGNDWTCERGYKRNDARQTCDPVFTP